jgi:hypothetical protein
MHKNQKNIFHFRWYKPASSYAALSPRERAKMPRLPVPQQRTRVPLHTIPSISLKLRARNGADMATGVARSAGETRRVRVANPISPTTRSLCN